MEPISSPIFQGISPEELQCMLECFHMRKQHFFAEETIYSFYQQKDTIGILSAGTALIERIDEKGNRTILERLECGGVFGEILIFENTAEDQVSVVAESACDVWFMRSDQLTKRCEKACAHHSRMVENMFRLVAEKATALSERVEVLSRRSIREKLLCYFQLQTYRRNSNTFSLPFSLSALADYISTDRSAMMRELKKLREEGLVQLDGRAVTLHNRL